MSSGEKEHHLSLCKQESTVRLMKRSVVGDNSRWTVFFDHISDSSGDEVPNYLVIDPKVTYENLVGGVCILPICEGKIGLVRYYRHPIEEFLWEAPRGFIDIGENPEQAALRELEEETGLVCDANNLISLGYYLPEPSTIRARGALFAADSCQIEVKTKGREIGLGDLHFFSKDQVLNMISLSEIQDASTLITCYRYFDKLIKS